MQFALFGDVYSHIVTISTTSKDTVLPFLAIFGAFSRPFVGFAILYHPETIRDRRNVQTPQLHRPQSARDA